MIRRSSIVVVLAVAASVLGTLANAPAAPDFQVGAAVVDASPSHLVDLSVDRVCLGGFGIGCSRPATGEREPLYARAIVVESGGEKVVLATSSNIGLFAKYKDRYGPVGTYDIRRAAALATGIPSNNIIITSDHSHSSPDVEGIWGGVAQAYLDAHAAAMIQAIEDANDALESADLYVGSATYTPTEPDQLKNHWDDTGTVLDQIDRELRVFQARRPSDDSVIATMINFAPHASVLDEDELASGDWTGTLGNQYAAEHGGVAMGMVGALGGIGARYSESQFDAFVSFVDGLTDEAVANASKIDIGGVEADAAFIREPLTAPLLYSALVPIDAQDDGNVLEASINRAFTPPWGAPGYAATYVNAIRIGDVLIAGAPGEAYPEISFALSRTVTAREHFVLGLANDQLGYLIAPLEGITQPATNGALYPLMGNDNFALSVSPTIGDHVTCSLLDLSRAMGLAAGDESLRCLALTAADDLAPPEEIG